MDSRIRPLSSSAVCLAVVLCIVTTGSLVESQTIETVPPKLYVKTLSKDVNLLCRSSKPATACSVKIPGFTGTYDVHNLPDGLGYYGNSLQRGDCGITFFTLKSVNEGKFQCNMTIGGEVFMETIEVVLTITPEPTDIEIGENAIVEQGAFAPNQTIRVKCTSRDAVPVANLTWLLDEKQIDGSMIGPLEFSDRVDKKGKNLTTVTQELNYFITSEDHGKKIICRAEHFAINKGYYRAFLPLNIRFSPERVPTIYIGDGEHTMVNITIRANPRPRTSWKVDGMTIIEGQSTGPYQAYYPRDMGFGNYLVLLRINERTEQTEIFELTATNELGSQVYVIKASKQGAEPEEIPPSPGRATTFWLISIWTYFCSVIVTCLLRVP
ncbi:fasciclin-3-like [Ochlerotatus camptorhynchus]|uniref:fasciclin-3-like n=1 Tax=Ochlerotatus camptorhynchus TaxID=644619 RepID=UPI0031E34D66